VLTLLILQHEQVESKYYTHIRKLHAAVRFNLYYALHIKIIKRPNKFIQHLDYPVIAWSCKPTEQDTSTSLANSSKLENALKM
jgi:hypothetical protein